MNLGQILVKYT